VNPALAELVALYGRLQECPPQEQADRREAFSAAIKAQAAERHLDHWRLSAYVQLQWERAMQAEERRKGLAKGSGL